MSSFVNSKMNVEQDKVRSNSTQRKVNTRRADIPNKKEQSE